MARQLTRRTLGMVLLFSAALLGTNSYAAELKPEKNRLEVAIAASGPLYLPIILANEAGYFSKRGVAVNISTLSATASAQALLSGHSGHLPGRHRDDSCQCGGFRSYLYCRERRSQHIGSIWSKRIDDVRPIAG